MNDWLTVKHGNTPLMVSFPHTGTEIPPDIETQLSSLWFARRDTDWWVELLYDFAHDLGATTVRTAISRTVIDVNRDPSGASLYPCQATTDLCPLTTFDAEPLYKPGHEPGAGEIARRRSNYFDPYHATLALELERLRALHGCAILYDAHSIRSRVSRLFDGELPLFNIGTNNGVTCDPALTASIEKICDAASFTRVTNGRFRGGWTTRHYGQPANNIHAVQMELSCRGYLHEPRGALTPDNWPAPYDPALAEPLRAVLKDVLIECVTFARGHER